MLDPSILKNSLDEFKENLIKRDIDIDINSIIELEKKRRKAKFAAEKIRAEQNKLGKEIAKADENEKQSLLKK